MKINYKNMADLYDDVKKFIPTLPQVDLVVGIPRDGLMVAMILSFYLNLPVTDIDGLLNKRLLATGHRFKDRNNFEFGSGRVLVIDDSIATGKSIVEAKEQLAHLSYIVGPGNKNGNYDITYAVMYAAAKRAQLVNHVYQLIEEPRVFAWNLADSFLLGKSCVDIDGVLCRDPVAKEKVTEKGDDENYREFLRTAPAIMKPMREIGWIVTGRHERYKRVTEQWLIGNNIRYRALVMRPGMEPNQAVFKARVYRKVPAILFVENRKVEAEVIAQVSKKPVLCTDTNTIIGG